MQLFYEPYNEDAHYICDVQSSSEACDVIRNYYEKSGIDVPYFRFFVRADGSTAIDYGSHDNFYVLRKKSE